jgi:hypothetical protein
VLLPDTDSIGPLAPSVSIRAASKQGERAEGVSSVVQAADRAPYRAKSIGRNRVFGSAGHAGQLYAPGRDGAPRRFN